ncbi:MAG: hypothetical protein ACTH7X_08640 [Brevibacterium aurantiacum]
MARSRASAKAAGSRHERVIADYLAEHVDDRIDRRVKTGAADRGDLGGVRTALGEKVVVELKDYGGQIKASEWVREAHVEALNDSAPLGVVVAKRRGVTDPGAQFVLMTVDDLIVLLGKDRPQPLSI